MVPAMSKTPITASSEAAATSGMPWSMEAGIRWVPMSPLVEAPQMKKEAARNQKSRCRTPRPSPRKALAMGLPVTATTASSTVAP